MSKPAVGLGTASILGGAAILGLFQLILQAASPDPATAQSSSQIVGLCRANASAPTYAAGQIAPCSMDLSGKIRIAP